MMPDLTALQITVHDPVTGETQRAEVPAGLYLLVCHAPCHRHGLEARADGTHVITVRGVRAPMTGLLNTTEGRTGE